MLILSRRDIMDLIEAAAAIAVYEKPRAAASR